MNEFYCNPNYLMWHYVYASKRYTLPVMFMGLELYY